MFERLRDGRPKQEAGPTANFSIESVAELEGCTLDEVLAYAQASGRKLAGPERIEQIMRNKSAPEFQKFKNDRHFNSSAIRYYFLGGSDGTRKAPVLIADNTNIMHFVRGSHAFGKGFAKWRKSNRLVFEN